MFGMISLLFQCFNTDQWISLLSTFVLFATMIVIIIYTIHTKRLADLQQKATLSPSVSILVKTQFTSDKVYLTNIIFKNNSRFDVTITSFSYLYWFKTKTENPDVWEFTIPPNSDYLITVDFQDLILEEVKYAKKELNILIMNDIWVDYGRSPYYLVIKYKAVNTYANKMPLTSPYIYSLEFKSNIEVCIMPEICNVFENKTSVDFNNRIRQAYNKKVNSSAHKDTTT